MRKTPLLLLPLALLLGCAGVFLLWSGGPEAAPSFAVPELEDVLEPARPLEVGANAPERAPDPETEEGLAAVAREQLGAKEEVQQLVVQVWNGQKGVPAAGAEVSFLDGGDRSDRGDPFAPHWSERAAKEGRQFHADAEGRVRLPPVSGWATVTARMPGRFGHVRVDRRHRPVETIVLALDETVTVRVVDAKGLPVAGAPVGIVQRVPVRQPPAIKQLALRMEELNRMSARIQAMVRGNPKQAAEIKVRSEHLARQKVHLEYEIVRMKKRVAQAEKAAGARPLGEREPVPEIQPELTTRLDLRAQRRTDAAGLAVVEHFQLFRTREESWWPREHRDQFEAVLLMPLQRAEGRGFAGRPVPEETIELHLPPTGSVVLRTVDLEGRPFVHPVHAELRQVSGDAAPWARIKVRKQQGEDRIEFPFVGLGVDLEVACRLDDDDFKWKVPRFHGPQSPGECMTLDVVVAPEAGMLSGRIVDGAGRPLAGVRPTFLINSLAGRLEGESVTLDVDGRFHLPYRVHSNHRPPFRLEVRRSDARPIAGLVLALPALPLRRVTDLGELRLEDFALVASGAVVDDRGQPVPGARIQLQRERDVGGKEPAMRFVDEAFVTASSGDDGTFELFGALEPGRYRLRIHAQDHFPYDSHDLRPGGTIEARLLRKARVVGTVLLPTWMKSARLRTELVASHDPKARRDDRVRDYRGEKFVYFDWVRPGVYDVLFTTEEFPDPILRVDGVDVQPGQVGKHPRLQDLDLTSVLHQFVVEAVDGQGRPLKVSGPLLARVMRPGGGSEFVGLPWKGRRIEFVHASPQLEVFPFEAGYQARSVVLAPGESQLQFLKIPPVEVTMPGLRKLVGDAMVWVALRQEGGGGMPESLAQWDSRSGKMAKWYENRRRRANGKMLGGGDMVRFDVMATGPHRVMAYLLGAGGKRKGRPVGVDLGVLDLRMSPGGPPFRGTVVVDAEKVRQGIAELAR